MKETLSDIISRRALLQGMALGAAAGTVGSAAAIAAGIQAPSISAPSIPAPSIGMPKPGQSGSTLTFEEIAHNIDQNHHVASGYTPNVLLRWGDKIFADAAAFDVNNPTAAAQNKQFGFNCSFTTYMPLPIFSATSDHGLLCINHESTKWSLMFPDDTAKKAHMRGTELDDYESNKLSVDIAAHGHTIVEVKKDGGKWAVVQNSGYNRRITAKTSITISGPCVGNERLKTTNDLTGTLVSGTIANSSGGVTPWGTVLVCEKNINEYFGGKIPAAEQRNYTKFELGSATNLHGWEKSLTRFNMEKEPLEPNRFGWVVEIDPYDPASAPVKRTALGRFRHVGAAPYVNKDGRIVVYMGDSGVFSYIYRFISKNKLDYKSRKANMNLLDEGTLSVAKFLDDGTMKWLPLVQGQGKLTPENGFKTQADVLIEALSAAELEGATQMDQPGDIVPNPVTGHVFAVLTGNTGRGFQDKNVANPRTPNFAGHIIELGSLTGDHADETYGWDFFVLCGNPMGLNSKTSYGPGTSRNGWLASPTNCTFDKKGRIWISTGQRSLQKAFQTGDGVWAADTKGDGAATTKYFYTAPINAEVGGPSFTPDNKTMFLAVEHPGDGEGATFAKAFTRWPDFDDKLPPRPSIVVITKDDGGEIGS